jgi:tetratricopeptide (TPR) repeat protein
MIASLVVVGLLAQSPGVDPNAPLPPGHPPLSNGTLPPGHPELNDALGTSTSGTLPAGHPALGSGGEPGMLPAPASLPAGHPQVDPSQKAMSMPELLQKLDSTPDLKKREKTFEIAAALGKLYYGSSRFADAAVYLRQALAKTEGFRNAWSEARRKAGSAALPAPSDVGCGPDAQSALDGWMQVMRSKLQAGQAGAALACGNAAGAQVVDVERVLANALFLSGDAPGALSELDRAVSLDDHDAEAVFLRGAVRIDAQGDDVKALDMAKKDLQRVAVLAPAGPRAPMANAWVAELDRAIAAGGLSKLDAKRAQEDKAKPMPALSTPSMPSAPFAGGAAAAPALSKDVVDAIQNTERTPELEQGLQKLVEEGEDLLAHGKYQDALDAYKRVVPFQPQNGRAKAGMAWALVGLGKPMADRVWMVAAQSDPSAIDKLGETLKSKGDAKSAQAVWAKLAQTAPDYAASAGLQQKLQ